MSPRRAVTLIELLVVMGVIVILVAIAMPVIGRAWDLANQSRCQSNLKNLTAAFLAFANDHGRRLPGSKNCYASDPQNPDHWDWLFGQYSLWDQVSGNTIQDRLKTAPQYGTIWPYVSHQPPPVTGVVYEPSPRGLIIYRCPSLRYQEAGSGAGSNGRFDYAAFSCFAGAPLKDISAISDLHFPLNPSNPGLVADTQAPFTGLGLSTLVERRPTPIICQEDPTYCINSNLEGQHSSIDQMAHLHNGGSYYGAIDGAVYFINEPDTRLTVTSQGTNLWWQNGPVSGQPVSLDGDGGWGWWSHR
jgi:prepilin-type N-terminal cleavage/methylation domain-containing protein